MDSDSVDSLLEGLLGLEAMRRVVLAAALFAVGCAAAGVREADPFRRSAEGRQQIRIHVLNLNFSDARLYAVAIGERKSLGVLAGKQDAVYTIDWNFTKPLSIEIDLVAGPRCTTRQITVDPGDVLDLRIEADFSMTRSCN